VYTITLKFEVATFLRTRGKCYQLAYTLPACQNSIGRRCSEASKACASLRTAAGPQTFQDTPPTRSPRWRNRDVPKGDVSVFTTLQIDRAG
jgi:hypothetical protein